VAELIESQQEEFEAADITQQETQQEEVVAEEPQVEQEEPRAEEDVPPKYRGKSAAEIARMHMEAEKLIGRQAQEVGEVRKLADELIKRQLESKKQEEVPATKEDEIDFFEDPKKAVKQAVETHPAIQQAKQQALELKQMQTINRLREDFPDFPQTINDPAFAEWVKGSPVRLQLYANADANADYDSAAELLNTWNLIKPKAVETKAPAPATEVKAAQKAAVKAATVDVGSNANGNTTSKIYRRADLIRLQLEDPDRYYQLQDEIMAAYSEGRVK
jgi:hypothetical protein